MNQEKIKKIKGLIEKIYVFSNEEISEITLRISYMSSEGLDELIETLKKGLKDQEELFRKWTERDPEFAKGLIEEVEKTNRELSQKYEKKEKGSAEEILKELN